MRSFFSATTKWNVFKKNKEPYTQILEILEEQTNNDKYSKNITQQYLLRNIIKLANKKVQDIMIPRVDIVAIREDLNIESIIPTIKKTGFSRFPVYKDNLDSIIGFIHIKDLVANSDIVINNILRQTLFISPYMSILDLLYEMKVARIHIAIVVDEFGGVDGLITLEDIMEEIVGEIIDEYDALPTVMIKKINDAVLEVNAKISLEELEEHVGRIFSDEEKEEFNTLSGLIVSIAGHIPQKHSIVRHESGFEFKVISADRLKVNVIEVYFPKDNGHS